MPYVVVVWDDAHCRLDAISREDANRLKPIRTVTVGHLVSQTEVGVVVAVDAYPDEPDHFANWHFVPAPMIVSLTRV